jgi:hypothetical protein
MSEAISFGNIVSSLRAVRDDYNEHLKAVPQYDAFLLVESSARKVADTLRDVAPQMAADVAEALEAAKAKFQQHLTSVAEYRALLAIDKLISDVAADLGVQHTTEITSAAEAQPADGVAQSQVESAQVAPPVAIVSSDPAEVAYVEAAPHVEVAEHAIEQNQLPEIAAPITAEAEMTSAEAISQIQTALLHAEPQTVDGQSAEALSTSEAAELTEGHTPDAELTTAAEPPPYGHEAERAA